MIEQTVQNIHMAFLTTLKQDTKARKEIHFALKYTNKVEKMLVTEQAKTGNRKGDTNRGKIFLLHTTVYSYPR